MIKNDRPFTELGNLIRNARKGLQRSQLWLATELGVHTQMISDIERGLKALPAKRFKFAQDALGITENEIIECLMESKKKRILNNVRGD